MTPNGHDSIQGMPPGLDVKAIKKETQEALIAIFKKHKLNWHQTDYILRNVVDISELM